jgi:hypothetical protein
LGFFYILNEKSERKPQIWAAKGGITNLLGTNDNILHFFAQGGRKAVWITTTLLQGLTILCIEGRACCLL